MHGLCITIAAPTMDALRARRDAWPDGTFTELRLDAVDRPDVAGALAGRRGPVLVTCRPRRQGGWFDGAEADRLALLQQAMALGAEAVDVADVQENIRIYRGRCVARCYRVAEMFAMWLIDVGVLQVYVADCEMLHTANLFT